MESFTCTPACIDDYYGFELAIPFLNKGVVELDQEANDANLFLLDDCTVVSNSNGKSKLITLVQQALGDYAVSVPCELFTAKQARNAEAAAPELARLRGKRAIFSSESEEGESFRMALLKGLSGGDEISVRPMYGTPFQFTVFGKIIIAVNKPPQPRGGAQDEATWRRLRLVSFGSKFCENPRKGKQEFKIDKTLPQKLKSHAEAMLCILLHKYPEYNTGNGLQDIPEVLTSTKNYRNDSDMFGDFARDNLEKKRRGKDTVANLLTQFTRWMAVSYPTAMKPNKKDFENYLTGEMGAVINHGMVRGVVLREDDLMNDMDSS
jgi:putative DNA primase/helicase